MKLKPVTFSFIISLSIAFFFLVITFWIFYKYSGSSSSASNALSTTGSYFGAVTTLAAAIIAAYLFNDWRAQHNKAFIADVAKQVLITVNNDLDHLTQMTGFLKSIPPNVPLSNKEISDYFEQLITAFLDNGKKTSAQTLILNELTQDAHLEKIRTGYHGGMIELAQHMTNIIQDNNSTGFLLNYINSNLSNFLIYNKNYKVKIVSFILAED